jgi:TRAP-type C4-dicarboxylate transport system permease small subunit
LAGEAEAMENPGAFPKWPDRLSEGIVWVTGMAVLLMTLLVLFDVLMRFLWDQPQLFVDELTSFLLVGVIFLGTAPTFRTGGHIRVDLIVNRMTARNQIRLRRFTLILGILLLSVIVGETTRSTIVAYELERQSAVMLYPLWIGMMFIPIGLSLMVVLMFRKLIEDWNLRAPAAAPTPSQAPPEISH